MQAVWCRCVGPLTERVPRQAQYLPRRATTSFREIDMKTTTQNSYRQVLIAAALAAAFVTVAGAAALPQVHVNYSDLNVNTTAGAAVLYQRIRGAAEQVCPTFSERDLNSEAAAKACKVRAIAEAVAAVHAPALTQMYEGKMGVKAARLASL
jgi:UrcA family protein